MQGSYGSRIAEMHLEVELHFAFPKGYSNWCLYAEWAKIQFNSVNGEISDD